MACCLSISVTAFPTIMVGAAFANERLDGEVALVTGRLSASTSLTKLFSAKATRVASKLRASTSMVCELDKGKYEYFFVNDKMFVLKDNKKFKVVKRK